MWYGNRMVETITFLISSLQRRTDGGLIFSEPDNISNIPGGSRFPQISSEGDNVYVVWEDAGALNDEDTFFSFSHDSGQTFSEPFNRSNRTSRSFLLQISSQGNNVYVVWEEFSDDRDIFFAGRTHGGQTFMTKNLSNTTEPSQDAQISSIGNNVYVVWEDDRDIFFAMSTTVDRHLYQNISNNTGRSFSPQISSIENIVYVVWQDDTDNDVFDIFFTFSHDSGQPSVLHQII